ncbi:MAG: excinuclease ABC subunit UvrC [Bacteroidota bacterium]
MTTEDYKKIASTLPREPGVYRFIDNSETILYVGKAKNLKNRIASYFGERRDRLAKTKVLVKKAVKVEYTIVETEHDALLLESSLIKKHQPRYNVMLKDGKSYSYICIKKERFSRVFLTRKVIRDGSTYFGPYVSKYQTSILLDLIKNIFQLRTCTLNLSKSNIDKGKFKVCLQYHIKNCKGPCVGYESEEEYNAKIEQIKNILKGRFTIVKNYLKEEMMRYAELMEFEKAQQAKENLAIFEDYQGKSTVASITIRNVDVFSIAVDEKQAFVNYLKIVDGAVIHTYTLEMMMNLDDDDEEDLLVYAIDALRKKFKSDSEEIILPYEVDLLEKDLTITIPKIGDKKKLLDLSQKNAKYYMLQKRKQEVSRTNKQTPAERILRTMQNDLQMDKAPMHIECFDNSNIQGTNPVASCVVFKNAKPSKKDYRKFKIKTVEGPNDFASMEEIVRRRYTRLINEKQPLPDLIIIDGGKGQLSSAAKILEELQILDKVTVIGIAKRLEEIYFPNDPIPLHINKKSETLKVIQHARNEAHRFAITFHRDLRSKNALGTELTDIPGIGNKTAEKLLQYFKSVKKLKAAPPEEVEMVIGKSASQKVLNYFEKQQREEAE